MAAQASVAPPAWKYPLLEQTLSLGKWLDRGLDSPQHNFLRQLPFMNASEDPKVRSVMFLVSEIFLNLPADNNSGSLMQYLCNI